MTTTTTARTESALAASARRYWSTQSDAKHRSTDEAAYARYADELLAIVPASGTLVDVGCGACEVTAHLAPYFDHVIGFDRSDSMLGAARARIAQLEIGNLEVRKGDATAMPERMPKADVVLSYGVVQYLSADELAQHLRECRRILADGGVVLSALVPNRALKDVYYYGKLVPAGDGVAGRLRSRLALSKLRWRGYFEHDPLWDGMGNWFTKSEYEAAANAAGFDAEFRHCWYYEYRFHALLTPRAEPGAIAAR
jgi:SAM-dependent methyltransferase